jgi:hypothetical protein
MMFSVQKWRAIFVSPLVKYFQQSCNSKSESPNSRCQMPKMNAKQPTHTQINKIAQYTVANAPKNKWKTQLIKPL